MEKIADVIAGEVVDGRKSRRNDDRHPRSRSRARSSQHVNPAFVSVASRTTGSTRPGTLRDQL